PDDPWRERFLPPSFLAKMLERGWLGEKSGQGFYKRVGKDREIHAIDWRTLDYHPMEKARLPELESVKPIEDLPQRLRALMDSKSRAGSFLWTVFSDLFLYSAERIPEISDRIVEIDRAMRWGYAHKLGPFELWDALGFRDTTERIRKEGRGLPGSVAAMIDSGAQSFYRTADLNGKPRTEYFDLEGGAYKQMEPRPGILVLADIKRARGVVKKNAGASLIDLDDGVLCIEFHSKMNALGDDAIEMMLAGVELAAGSYDAIVIGNEGDAFSAGANLMLILLAAQEGDWEDLDLEIRRFQQVNMALKYSPRPVVAAPFGRVLGGGAEVVLHCTRAQASAELYMGLVEVGVGLIPAGGGCKEMLMRLHDPRRVFELIGYAKVSGSAEDARSLGLLHKADMISMNPERLLEDAKILALTLRAGHAPGAPRSDVKVSGESGFAMMKLGAWMLRQGDFISDHDMLIAEKLAHVLSGGRLSGEQTVSEQYLLDLEREAFLSLCGHTKTQERIQHMLKTGKPLRN
ncbi:MAG: enoyl-CoA hydratase-related protein, partial [Bryobacteraceae bacterium]